jgi:hypothetical protein
MLLCRDDRYIDVGHYDIQVPVGYYLLPQLGVSETRLSDF